MTASLPSDISTSRHGSHGLSPSVTGTAQTSFTSTHLPSKPQTIPYIAIICSSLIQPKRHQTTPLVYRLTFRILIPEHRVRLPGGVWCLFLHFPWGLTIIILALSISRRFALRACLSHNDTVGLELQAKGPCAITYLPVPMRQPTATRSKSPSPGTTPPNHNTDLHKTAQVWT